MPTEHIQPCTCDLCQVPSNATTRQYHQHIKMFLPHLNETQRRWYVGTLSLQPDSPTDHILAQVTGLHRQTIRRGRREVLAGLPDGAPHRQRQPGAGRPAAEKKTQRSKP
jgi:hypothetical protein